MTVNELRFYLEKYKNTDMDYAQVIIFDTTHTDNPINIKIDKFEEYRGANAVAIYASAKPDIIINNNIY